MKSFIEIGGTPVDEDCAQIGEDIPYDGQNLNKLECAAYIVALTKVYGMPPGESRFTVHGNRHDFGTYYEVRYVFDSDDEDARRYAARVEHGLRTWFEASMWRPVFYADGRPIAVIRLPELWSIETNPHAHTTIEARDAPPKPAS